MTRFEHVSFWICLGLAALVLVSGVLTFSIPALALGTVLLLLATTSRSVVGRLAVIQDAAETSAYLDQRRARNDENGNRPGSTSV